MKVFLSKFNKRLIDLALPKIIMYYGRQITLVEAFTIVEQCDSALYKHDATDLLSLLINSSKFRKTSVVTARLA